MPGFLQVRNWDRWQTYRNDRTPPWIKLHRGLLLNPEWQSLNDAEKGVLVSIWMLAAERNGRVPDDPLLIRKLCNLDFKPDLDRFLSLQFLEKIGKRRRRPSSTHVALEESRGDIDKEEEKNVHSDERMDGFDEWYQGYPRKEAKQDAMKAWKGLKNGDRQKAIDGLATWSFPTEKKFTPLPASWLRGKRWEDDQAPCTGSPNWWQQTDAGVMAAAEALGVSTKGRDKRDLFSRLDAAWQDAGDDAKQAIGEALR